VLGEVAAAHYRVQHSEPRRLKIGRFRGRIPRRSRGSIKYAKERKGIGKSISEFGMIQHKIAEMAIRMYASESMTYRVVGNIEAQLEDFRGMRPMPAIRC